MVSIFLGCASFPVPPPVVPGTHSLLLSDVRTMVMGQDDNAVMHVREGLQQAGFTVINGAFVHPTPHTQQLSLENTEPHPFAEVAVLVMVEVGGLEAYPTVVVQGVDLQTGELLWNGNAVQVRQMSARAYDRAV